MNNLSLQTIQIATQKSPSESVSKGDSGAGAIDSGVTKSSFQTTLNKQVQANESQNRPTQESKQPSTKSVLENKIPSKQRASDQLAAKLQVQAKARTGDHVVNDAKLVLDDSGSVKRALAVEGLIQKKSSASDDGDTKVETSAVGISDVNSGVVDASSAIAPMVLGAFKGIQTQVSPTLDDALSKELTRGKSIGIPGNDAQVTQSMEKRLGEKASSDTSQWVDSVLANTAKQSGIDESSVSKLLFDTSKDSTRESVLKEVAMPANYQAVLQANTPLSAQLVGSANVISSYPGKSGWDQAISQKVVWMVGAGEQSATLTLNPPDLGPLQVVIHVHNDQADTTFISDNKEVRQALENGMSNLRDKMSDAGIQLGQANVSTGSQSQQEFQRATQSRSATASNDSGSIDPQILGVVGTESLVRITNGLVDTFA
ncbi:flagellar hook-length control protein [mine drainage metagenome]|uniref:Flagellar hook-length control protein n=1 Tax=mine drainage metagenome TaxID=410659 RepID=A0A1J5RZT8_9ZZZZ